MFGNGTKNISRTAVTHRLKPGDVTPDLVGRVDFNERRGRSRRDEGLEIARDVELLHQLAEEEFARPTWLEARKVVEKVEIRRT